MPQKPQHPALPEQPKQRGPTKAEQEAQKLKSQPWYPTHWELADADAIQAVDQGRASPEQQRRAMNYIINELCGYYDLSYRPGEDGRRDTDFAEGKRFVGAQIVKLSKISLAALRTKVEGNPAEPKS